MNMSKADAGKLGAKSYIENYLPKYKAERDKKYLKNPTKCKTCDVILPYEKKGNKFCSRSCAAKHNNIGKRRHGNAPTRSPCLHCGVKTTNPKYCSVQCQKDFEYKERLRLWKKGDLKKGKFIKRYLLEQNDSCWECGIKEWNGKQITLELEHIDGNSNNNSKENLSLLCPNCHSQTDTYKGKNVGNGRHYRRQRYAEGKSY